MPASGLGSEKVHLLPSQEAGFEVTGMELC